MKERTHSKIHSQDNLNLINFNFFSILNKMTQW